MDVSSKGDDDLVPTIDPELLKSILKIPERLLKISLKINQLMRMQLKLILMISMVTNQRGI